MATKASDATQLRALKAECTVLRKTGDDLRERMAVKDKTITRQRSLLDERARVIETLSKAVDALRGVLERSAA